MNRYTSDFYFLNTNLDRAFAEKLQILHSGVAASRSFVASSCNLKQVSELPVKPMETSAL